MPDSETDHAAPSGPRLLELVGLVIGFSLAAVLIRTFLGEFHPVSTWRILVLILVFLWLGMAMSGPLVLLLVRRRSLPRSNLATTHPPSRFSNAEMAWVGIGGYFIAMTLFYVPLRRGEPLWAMLLLMQVIAGVILLIWIPWGTRKSAFVANAPTRWTNRAALWVFGTWPFAWAAMILAVAV